MSCEKSDGVIIKNIKDFELLHTFECGQCFRWHRQFDGSYTGVVNGDVFNIKRDEEVLSIKTTNPESAQRILMDYLDIQRDYGRIKDELSKDEILNKAIDLGYGIRILKQEHWECLASFIISANNRIPMIVRAVESIAKNFGSPIEFNGKTYFSFPEPEKLTEIEEDTLALCGVGFRCKYIMHAARMVSSGEVDLNAVENMDNDSAREELMKIPGVGPKIADCVLLYSYGRTDVFPTDVWIKRIVEVLYFRKKAKLNEIQDFAKSKFGSLAGFAQQYLFYYARENRIGGKQDSEYENY